VIVARILPLPYGSDHASFLEAGIPAFNLSCQFPAWTYHTSEDTAARVDPETLFASLELVSGMVEILDGDSRTQPEAEGEYLPIPMGGRVFFVPRWLLRVAGAV